MHTEVDMPGVPIFYIRKRKLMQLHDLTKAY